MSRTGLLAIWNSEHLVEMFNRKCTEGYKQCPNHFKSALGSATYVYASWDSLPPDVGGAEPKSQMDRSTDAQNQLILCSLVGSHKFKPKSQYKNYLFLYLCPFSASHFGVNSCFFKLQKSVDSSSVRISSASFGFLAIWSPLNRCAV